MGEDVNNKINANWEEFFNVKKLSNKIIMIDIDDLMITLHSHFV